MALEPDMNDPDWERYRVASQGGMAPVGDPTRWGAQAYTRLEAATGRTYSQQILAIGTRDNYARAWSVIGTLTLPIATWGGDIQVGLEITLGVGQIQITQGVILVHGPNPTPPAPYPPLARGGLCTNQYFLFGGPYAQIAEPTRSQNPGLGILSDHARPFAIIGGLIGQSISIRAFYDVNQLDGLATISRLAMIVAPYAAGEQL